MIDGRAAGVPWFKILMFAMVAVMLAGIANVILDAGLGAPDESRRVRHPSGFSLSYPNGWTANVVRARNAAGSDSIEMAPARVTGRETRIVAARADHEPDLSDKATRTTFQDAAAWVTSTKARRDSLWRVDFQRGDAWYSITIASPVELDWDRDPLMAYARSFRVEAPISATFAASVPTTATVAP